MSRNNAAAWEQIKKDGLTVDVQIYPNDDGSQTAYVGTVYKDRTFAGTGFMGTKKFSITMKLSATPTPSLVRSRARQASHYILAFHLKGKNKSRLTQLDALN